jgi:hypothetical protein
MGFKGDELLELLCEISQVHLQVRLSPGNPSNNLLDMSKVIIKLIALLLDLKEPTIRAMQLRKSIDKGISKVIKYPRRSRITSRATSRTTTAHGSIPVGALEERMQDRSAAQCRVERESVQEALEGVGATGGKVRAEAVAADIFHALLVGQRGYGSGGILAGELFVEEYEVCEATADGCS